MAGIHTWEISDDLWSVVKPLVPAYRGQIFENRSLAPRFSGFGGGDDNLEQSDDYLRINTMSNCCLPRYAARLFTAAFTAPAALAAALFAAVVAVAVAPLSASAVVSSAPVIQAEDGSASAAFAARELQRYIYLRTGALAQIENAASAAAAPSTKTPAAVPVPRVRLALDPQLAPEEYTLRTENNVLSVCGGSPQGLLYGAYRLAEQFGVRFYLHGDVIPDKKIPFALPQMSLREKPLFALRGLNPWGSHPHGFDYWNADDFIAHIGQLAKMRMNFIGLHCYSEKLPYAEPTVWIGREKDFRANGEVTASYTARYFTSAVQGQPWGKISPKTTDNYNFGADKLFPETTFAPDVMRGLAPAPETPQDCNLLFNRTALQFNKAFTFAKETGVKTCIGLEAPLALPAALKERLKKDGKNPDSPETIKEIHKAIFRRIVAAHPLDYYWIWTDENWTWSGNKSHDTARVVNDILLAKKALEEVGNPFQLATAGWVVGPAEDRALLDKQLPPEIAISSISRNLGHTPLDAAYEQIKRPRKWAIPWMESDEFHGLNNPQLFVARTRKDAADALAAGCEGLMGLHWRTAEIAPNIAALAQAAWRIETQTPAPVGRRLGNAGRGLDSSDFWRDWAQNMFGEEIAADAAKIFNDADGRLEVIVARSCPGGQLSPYYSPWEKVKSPVNFVDEFCKLEARIKSSGDRERFLFWKNFFLYYRHQGILRCKLGEFDTLRKAIEHEENTDVRRHRAEKELLPVYAQVVKLYGEMLTFGQETVTTTGGLATLVFNEQSAGWRKIALDTPRAQTLELLGKKIPPEMDIWNEYRGAARIFIPTLRTSARAGETIVLPVRIHAAAPPKTAVLHWRKMGARTEFAQVALTHLRGSCYEVKLPVLTQARDALEYYVEAEFAESGGDAGGGADGAKKKVLRFPATAPELCQTVVLFGAL